MTQPRLIATDLDGTLLRNDGSLSERTRKALDLATAGGVEVVLVTARPPRYVDALVAAHEVTGTAVCSNGALVYDIASRTVLKSLSLEIACARAAADALTAEVPGIGFAIETGHQVLFAPGYGLRLPEDAGAEFPVERVEDLWQGKADIVKLLAWSAQHDVDAMLAVAERAAGALAQITHSGGRGLLEISAPGVTKAGTLAELCAARGIGAADVVAFGDMPNDLSILNWAGRSYAVADAHPTVLDAVPRHTRSNEDDGVAVVLEELFGC